MSRRIDGPLTETTRDAGPPEEVAPEEGCPLCGRDLKVVRARPLAGIVCGIEWTLLCPATGDAYTFITALDFHDEAYGEPA